MARLHVTREEKVSVILTSFGGLLRLHWWSVFTNPKTETRFPHGDVKIKYKIAPFDWILKKKKV